MNGKNILLLVLLFGGFALYLSYRVGSQKNVYQVIPFGKFIPIPNIYDSYTASAASPEDGKIKITWNYVSKPANPSVAYLIAIGKVETKAQPYYLLELDGKIFVEKGQHIEPLIKALCALSRGGPENNHPQDMDEIIACLPDKPDVLIDLASRFKAPNVPPPIN